MFSVGKGLGKAGVKEEKVKKLYRKAQQKSFTKYKRHFWPYESQVNILPYLFYSIVTVLAK